MHNYINQQLNLEIDEKQVQTVVNKEKIQLKDELYIFLNDYIKNYFQDELNNKKTTLEKNIRKFEQLKEQNKTKIQKIEQQIEASKNSIAEIEIEVNKIPQTIEKEKSLLNNLFEKSKFKFIEVNNTEENKNNLRKLIDLNKNEYDDLYFYITKGVNGNNSHWFLTIQQGQDIYNIDPLGAEERKDFFDFFVKDNDSNTHLHYFNNQTKLQFTSGVCEIYSIKLAFYLLRARLFNSINGRFNKFLLNQKNQFQCENLPEDNLKIINMIEPVLNIGMEEIPFAVFLEKQNRLQIISDQIKRLKKEKELIYGFDLELKQKITFNKMFEDDLLMAQQLFDKYKRPTVENLTNEIFNVYTNNLLINKIKNQQSKEQQNIFKNINNLALLGEEEFKNTIKRFLELNETEKQEFFHISDKQKEIVYKEKFAGDNYINFENFNIFFNTFDIIRNSQELYKKLLKQNIFDLNNPNSFLRSGHMYFEALRYQEKQYLQIGKELQNEPCIDLTAADL